MISSISADFTKFVLVILIPAAASQCSFPNTFQNSIWLDSDKGTLTFTGSTMEGWEFTDPSGSIKDTWECYLSATITNTQLTLALNICNPVTSGPTENEYHMLVKNDNVANAVMSCPEDFHGRYYYNLTNSSGTYCNTGSEVWDVCINTQQMVFNYNQCSAEVAFSASGIVSCIFNMSSGTSLLQTVLNSDVILGSNNHRFTCLISSLNPDGSLIVSQASGSCTKDQTSDSIPTTSAGVEKGHKLVLVPHINGLCPVTTTTSSTTPTTTATTTTTTTTTTTSSTSTSISTSSTTSTTTHTPTTSVAQTTTSEILSSTTNTDLFVSSSSSSETNNTLAYAAFGILGGIVFILIVVGLVCIMKKKCCKDSSKPPPTPDIVIEGLPHTLYGKKGLPSLIEDAPRATMFTIDENPKNDVVVFPKAKTNDFLVSLPRRDLNAVNKSIKAHAVVQYKEMPDFRRSLSINKTSNNSNLEDNTGKTDIDCKLQSTKISKPSTTKKHVQSEQPNFFRYEVSHRKEDVSVMDPIIMDESVNYALTYHPSMIEAKRDWDKSNPFTVKLPKNSVPLTISPETVSSLNKTLSASKSQSNFSGQYSSNIEESVAKKTSDAETQTANGKLTYFNETNEISLTANTGLDEQTNGHSKIVSLIQSERKTSPTTMDDTEKEDCMAQTASSPSIIKNDKNLNERGIKRHFSDTTGYKQSRKLVVFRQKRDVESNSQTAISQIRSIQVTPVNEISNMSLPVSPVQNGDDSFGHFLNKRNDLVHRTSTPVKRNRSFSVTPTFDMKGKIFSENAFSEIK